MKTFSRFRTPKEIKAACKKAGLRYNQDQFERGSDHVTFDFVHGTTVARLCYNTVNGRAFGEFGRGAKGKRRPFSTDTAEHEHQAWFQALLEFIYVA
jgi:hypothetical protein